MLTLATWIGAAATAGLLIGAGFTVWFARKAFIAQSQQLHDQQEINRKQAEVLDLQVTELRESLDERKRDAQERRRAQAAQVFTWVAPRTSEDGEGSRPAVCLSNSSHQPVYDLRVFYGDSPAHWMPHLMPGEEGTFPGTGSSVADGTVPLNLEFRDAVGVRWRTTNLGELTELPTSAEAPARTQQPAGNNDVSSLP